MTRSRLTRTARRKHRGQALVETAIIAPILVALGFGVADGGRAFSLRETVTNASRQALRIAVSSVEESGSGSLHPGKSACQKAGATFTGTASGVAHLPAQSGDDSFMADIARAAWMESSNSAQVSGSALYNSSSPSTLTVTWHCLNGAVETNATAASTDPSSSLSAMVTATVTAHFGLITPFVASLFSNTTVRTTLIQRAEY